MNSLEFCNAVVQVAHPLVRSQLLDYLHNGFLVPVVGPALHKVGDANLERDHSYTGQYTCVVSTVVFWKRFFGCSLTLHQLYLIVVCMKYYNNLRRMIPEQKNPGGHVFYIF